MFRVMRASYDGAGDAGGGGQAARGRYRIEGTLGRGTLGTVHRALDTEQGRPVAIKLFDRDIDPDGDAARRMLADLEVASGLLNPHLVPALDAGVLDGQLFIVEPLLEGQSLSDRLARAPLPPMETVRLALEVLVGLDALHRHLLNHLDLHPRNIFVVRDPVGLERVLVGGVGQHHALALDNARGRVQGVSRARPEYLAPEIISGKPRDVRTDIYQLGLVMYASLTGSPPFIGGDPEKVARRHALERPPSPMNKRPEAEVPDALDTVVVRCLEKIPRKRYSSAMELTRDLEQVARKGAAGAIGTSGRFRAVNFSDLPREPSSAPPPREPTGSLGGSVDRSPSGSVEEVFQSPSGSVEEPPPFADFDAEPPPAGPPTHLDVRKLLSAPPKIDRPPRFADGLPPGLTGDRPGAKPAPAPTAERTRRATPPIASGRAPVDDAAPAPATAAYGAAGAGLSESAASSQTLVDPLFRPPLRAPTPDADDTGSHELSSFPGAALVGEDESRGVDNAETRAPTAPVELAATMLGGPRPGIEAAVEADLSERTAFDGGAASQAAAAAVAAADAIERQPADPAVAGRPAVDDAPDEGRPDTDAADAGPSEMGDAGPDPGESGWSVGDDPALEDDITHGLPRPSRAPWAIAVLLLIIAAAAFALYQRETAESPEAAEGPEPPSKIQIAAQPPPEPPPETEAAEPEAPAAPDGAAELRALEATARAALAAERWRGAPDALAESLAALRTAAPDAPAIRELSTRGAEELLSQSRAALAADDYDTALDRARSALAVAPGFASAERQIADVARARAAQAKAAQAEAARASADAEREKAEREKAEREKAEREKAAQGRAEREKAEQTRAERERERAEQESARQAREERAARAKADEEATARAAAEAARRAQADQEREEREAAAAAAAAEAEKAARAQARQEAKALVREGQGHISGGRWDQAKQVFEQALERDAGLAAAHAGLGDVAFQQQRFADAVTHHRRSVQNHKSNAGYHVNLGMAYFKLKNYAQAKASWEKALELDPGNAKATKYLSVVSKKL